MPIATPATEGCSPIANVGNMRALHDEKGCLASFGKSRVAYLPASAMGGERLRDLETLLDERAS